MGLFLVHDPKRFIAINYPNGEAVTIKPILQMRSRAHEEANDTSGAGAGLEVVSPALPAPSNFNGPFLSSSQMCVHGSHEALVD